MNSQFRGQTAGIYPRVSTKRQAKGDRTSILDQIDACRVYADVLEMEVDEDCVVPDAYTSTQMSRPGLNQLLATMKAHRVQNLIIDSADRLSRAGALVAATFLNQFIEAGIVLHVVSEDLIVNDDDGVWKLLEAARHAQQDNKLRARKVKRTKISRAKKGIYNRGNHAPYGYHYVPVGHDESGNPTDKLMERDERTYGERGFVTDFAPNPYATRCEIIRLYTDQGWSFQKIANKLNATGVPTAHALLKRTNSQGVWYAKTINYLLTQPINSGRLVNHFAETEESPAQVIDVASVHGNPAPLVNDRSLAVIAKRRERNLEAYYSRTTLAGDRALLGGRLAKCGACGGTVIAKGYTPKGKTTKYTYYRCARHDRAPSCCPGMNLDPKEIDKWAWLEVMGAMAKLTETDADGDAVSYTDLLVQIDTDRENAASAAGELSPAASLANLKAARDNFMGQVANLKEGIRLAKSPSVIASLVQSVEDLEPEIQKADQDIAKAERQMELHAQRVQVLAEFLGRYRQYQDVLWSLDTRYTEDILIMKSLLRSIGAEFTLDPDVLVKAQAQGSEPDMPVVITLTPQSALPWLTVEEMDRIVNERRERSIQSALKELEAERLVATLSGSWS